MDKNELIQFWLNSADYNVKSMLNMFGSGEYMWALFVGHLTIEKMLKAYFIKMNDEPIPHIHNLYKLAVKCNLDLSEAQKDALQKITLFNIKARYEDVKNSFYKKCTKEFTKNNIELIEETREWLNQKILEV